MAPLQLPGKMATVCFGEACAGIWARSPPKGSPKHGGEDDQLALETLAVFLILWLIFTLVAVLREMSLRRYLYAQLSGLANSQPAEEKAPAMRNILRQFEKLNEQFPVETASAEAAAEACTVCLDLIGESCPVRKLDCGHVFHISYVFWLERFVVSRCMPQRF